MEIINKGAKCENFSRNVVDSLFGVLYSSVSSLLTQQRSLKNN